MAGHNNVSNEHPGMAGHNNAMAGHNMSNHTPPGRNVTLRGGGSANFRPNGQIRTINHNGMHIEHGFHGGRTVVGEHHGVRVVNMGRHGGYVQRPYMTHGGHPYFARTFYDHGHYRSGVYRGYFWHGHNYYGYHPSYWYHPGFYAWGYHPWGAPVYWGVGAWGWGGAPWYGYYGGWFTPYPYYVSPAFWLTDYLIAENLREAYEARADARAAAEEEEGGDYVSPATSGPVVLTPEVKQAISEEVKAELAEQQAEAAQSGPSGGQAAASGGDIPPALDPARRTFVVDSNLTVAIVGSGQECALSGGDVITRLTDTPDEDQTVNASVSASKKSECAAGQTIAVKVDDLQEMQNHFSEQLANGMSELAKKQGTGGIPKAPDMGTMASDVPPPPPDNSAGKTLEEQQAEADQAEAQAKREAGGGGGE
jgi:hypothetical protein